MGDWTYPLVFGTTMGVMAVTIFGYVAIRNWISNRRHSAGSGSIQRRAA